MRRVPLVLLAVAGGALARPAERVTWADWVGDWQGKLAWASCTSDGEPQATFALDANDGAIAIDLGGAGAGLGALPLVDDSGRWVGQQGDVSVRVARAKADELELAVELDSGCSLHASLRRASVGIAACDRLAAWARVEASCTRLKRPLENPARLARQRATWMKARGDAIAPLAMQCEARAAKVEAELVEAGCAPGADPCRQGREIARIYGCR